MPRISVKLSERLHQQILLIMQELNLDNISDAVRVLLRAAIETQNSPVTKQLTDKLQKKAANYSIMAYCLIDKFLSTSVKNGQLLSDEAHDKAEKLIDSLISKL